MSFGLGFISPGATGEGELLDASTAAKRRKVLEALSLQAADTSPIASPFQGLARVVQGGLAGYELGGLDKQEGDERKRIAGLPLFGGGAAATAAAPAASPGVGAVAGAMGTAPAGASDPYAKAIQANESGGNYGALGPVTKSGDRAYGAYQVMGNNVGPWTQEVLGRSLTPDQFLNDRAAQDAVFKAKFGQSVAKYGNPQDAASVWFTGKPLAQGATRKDILGTTGQGYVDNFIASLGSGGAKVAAAMADVPMPGAQQTGFVVPQSGQPAVAGAMGAGNVNLPNVMSVLSSPYATPGQKAVAQALVQRAVKDQEPKVSSVAPGGRLVDERTGRVLYEAPQKDEPTTNMRDYYEARKDDPSLTFQSYMDRQRRPMTPTLVSPGTTVLPPGEFSAPSFTAPDPKGAEQQAKQGREEAGNLRKEIHQLPSYKNYSQALPVYQSMVDAAPRNSKASDLNLVYGLGKIMDPGSVVREGEMVMVKNTGSLPEWLSGAINGLNGGQTLTPATRQQIMAEAFGRMQAYESAFNQDATGYRAIVDRNRMNPDDVMPNFGVVKPYQPPDRAEAAPKADSPKAATKAIGGKTYVQRNGKWFEE